MQVPARFLCKDTNQQYAVWLMARFCSERYTVVHGKLDRENESESETPHQIHAGSEQLAWPLLLPQKVLLQICSPVRLSLKQHSDYWRKL